MVPSETTYSVGWYKYTQEELEYFFPIHVEYREQVQSIVPFGSTNACWKDTPQEAQEFLDQITSVNSAQNLKELMQGEKELFVIQRELSGLDWPQFVISKALERQQ